MDTSLPQMASLLLMPPPTREEDRISRALPIVIDQRYILDIDIVVVRQTGNSALIRPTSLVSRSGDIEDGRLRERIAFATRAAQVRQLHNAADNLPDGLASLVRQHAALVDGASEIGAAVRAVVDEIIGALDWYDAYYLPGTDPLPALRVLAGVSGLDEITVPTPPETPEDAPRRPAAGRAHLSTAARARRSRLSLPDQGPGCLRLPMRVLWAARTPSAGGADEQRRRRCTHLAVGVRTTWTSFRTV